MNNGERPLYPDCYGAAGRRSFGYEGRVFGCFGAFSGFGIKFGNNVYQNFCRVADEVNIGRRKLVRSAKKVNFTASSRIASLIAILTTPSSA
jgi:hypothetical protein